MKPGRYIIINKNDIIETPFWVHSDFNMLDILEIDEEKEEVRYMYVGDKILRHRDYTQFIKLKLAPHSPLMEELI
jgi:hypothetical protein